MDDFPLVTIGIPTVSRLSYLREAVRSALGQTYPRLEIVINQNHGEKGLDKDLAEWAQEQAATYSNVRYFAGKKRLSIYGNFNATADRAQGKYLAFLADDDRFLPTFISELVDAIESHNANIAFSNQWIIDDSGVRLQPATGRFTRFYGRDQLLPGLQRNAVRCVWQNSVPIAASLLRTADAVRLRFREDANTGDLEFNARLAAAGGQYVFVPNFLAEYRTHPESETSSKGLDFEKLADYLSDIPVPLDCKNLKRRTLEKLVCAVAKQRLLCGDVKQARELFSHKYYPRFTSLYECGDFRCWMRGAAQRMLARLPGNTCAKMMAGYEKCRRIFAA